MGDITCAHASISASFRIRYIGFKHINGVFMRLTAVAFLCVTLAGCGSGSDAPVQDAKTAATQTQEVLYRVVETWSLPNGGFGRAVVVDPSMRNQADLLILANQLKLDTAGDRNAFVFVFDDPIAASNRKSVLSKTLTEAEWEHIDQHYIGSYQRIPEDGLHALRLNLDGANGPVNQIDF